MSATHTTTCEGPRRPGVRRGTAVAIGALMTLTGWGCGPAGAPPRGAAPASMATGQLPRGPAEPKRGLPMPSLDVAWMPPILTAGDLGPLRDALQRHDSVALHLGRRLGGLEWEARAGALVQALRPQTSVTASAHGIEPFAGVTLPLERVTEEGQRPRYRWSAGALPASPDASATLMVDDAQLEPGHWRSLPARAVGSCRAPLEALAAGQEQSLAELEPFLDHADRVLWQVYQPALAAAMPRLQGELASYEPVRTRSQFDDSDSWEQYQCGHAYWNYLEAFSGCLAAEPDCPAAPRVFLIGGARIGTVEPSLYIPTGCASKVGHDYVSELRTIAVEAAEVAMQHLAPSWSALADRLGAVTEVYEALEDVCVPRRRRFTEQDLTVVRERLAAIGQSLASDEMAHPRGRWTSVEQPFHVPGFGPVQQVAFYDAGEGSPSEAAVAQARALRELVLKRALCRSAQPALPLAAAVVQASGEVESFGYFFEEELFCGELPPLIDGERIGARDSERGDTKSAEEVTVEPAPPASAPPASAPPVSAPPPS